MDDAPEELIAGRFRVLEVLGRGGQGAVYRAEMVGPHGFRRVVAVKRFANAGSSVASLVDEARLASMISHPNVVQTLDIVEDDRELAIVMEYVGGVSLARLVATHQVDGIPLPIALAIVGGALRGLHAVHEARGPDGRSLGIVHRDISPSNIMIDRHGLSKVLDFGIAKAEGRSQEVTRVGRIKGKLGYVAPEQIHGKIGRPVDIWAMGVVLWEAVCGRRLFEGRTTNRILKRILAEQVNIPAELDAGVAAVLARALDRDPNARYATAADMADAIDALGSASPQEVVSFVAELLPTESSERSSLVTAGMDTRWDTFRSSTLTRWVRSPAVWSGTTLVCMLTAVVTWAWLQRAAPSDGSAPARLAPPTAYEGAVEVARDSEARAAATSSTRTVEATPGSTETDATDSAGSSPPRRRAKKRRRSPSARPKQPPKEAEDVQPSPPCTVPWTYVDGVKTWKRECF